MPASPISTPDDVLAQPAVMEAVRRRVIEIDEQRIRYSLAREQNYDWSDPEEWVRAATIAWLIVDKGYPVNRIKLEISVPRRTPSDFADIVVYEDDSCRIPYLVVENKASGQAARSRDQGIEQAFGNANSLRAPLLLYDEGGLSAFFDVANFPSTERAANRLGERSRLPSEYGNVPTYAHVAGESGDITVLNAFQLEVRIRRTHSLIWAGGRRDPLTAFDEWSKLLFAKVIDERTTRSGDRVASRSAPTRRQRQLPTGCTHFLLWRASPIPRFSAGTGIALPDAKVADVVRTLQDVAFTRTDVDSIGKAFEQFFGSIFRGGLGQYFTMRQLARSWWPCSISHTKTTFGSHGRQRRVPSRVSSSGLASDRHGIPRPAARPNSTCQVRFRYESSLRNRGARNPSSNLQDQSAVASRRAHEH